MSGLEKIRERILQGAEETAAARLEAAEAEARVIKSEAVRDADEIAKDVRARTETELKAYSERVDSSLDMEHRTKILAAKQEIIEDVITEAKKRMAGLPSRDYFDLMLKLIEKHVQPEEGVVYFSAEDLARIPDGFASDVKEAAEKAGGKLSISRESRKIGPGFILSYGGIEENCTLDALFEEKKDDLTDTVKEIMFE
ncbi:MAG: V-type ATP synthase subunit E [Eubacterium sp.]|nr:V-type ATP synthase subunit E [Eubacterium sp.]